MQFLLIGNLSWSCAPFFGDLWDQRFLPRRYFNQLAMATDNRCICSCRDLHLAAFDFLSAKNLSHRKVLDEGAVVEAQ